MVSKKSRREFFKSAGWIGTGLAVDNAGRGAARATSIAASDVSGLTNPPLDVVRVGMIGAGIRGTAHVGRLLRIEGCDNPGGLRPLRTRCAPHTADVCRTRSP